MINLRENLYAVEVPDGAINFTIENYPVTDLINGRDMKRIEWDEDSPTCPFVIIPPGTWQIVCTSKEVTRMQASEIVDHCWVENSKGDEQMNCLGGNGVWFNDPLAALRSLLTSKGCDLNKTYLILKKQ